MRIFRPSAQTVFLGVMALLFAGGAGVYRGLFGIDWGYRLLFLATVFAGSGCALRFKADRGAWFDAHPSLALRRLSQAGERRPSVAPGILVMAMVLLPIAIGV